MFVTRCMHKLKAPLRSSVTLLTVCPGVNSFPAAFSHQNANCILLLQWTGKNHNCSNSTVCTNCLNPVYVNIHLTSCGSESLMWMVWFPAAGLAAHLVSSPSIWIDAKPPAQTHVPDLTNVVGIIISVHPAITLCSPRWLHRGTALSWVPMCTVELRDPVCQQSDILK